jgi:hypothetical protein
MIFSRLADTGGSAAAADSGAAARPARRGRGPTPR